MNPRGIIFLLVESFCVCHTNALEYPFNQILAVAWPGFLSILKTESPFHSDLCPHSFLYMHRSSLQSGLLSSAHLGNYIFLPVR